MDITLREDSKRFATIDERDPKKQSAPEPRAKRKRRERASPGRDMLKRPGLRRSRARRAKRRQSDPRRRMPRLSADRGDQLREQDQFLDRALLVQTMRSTDTALFCAMART